VTRVVNVFRPCPERRPGFELAAVNDAGEHTLRSLSIPEPALLPWRELGIDVVDESIGRFEKRAGSSRMRPARHSTCRAGSYEPRGRQ